MWRKTLWRRVNGHVTTLGFSHARTHILSYLYEPSFFLKKTHTHIHTTHAFFVLLFFLLLVFFFFHVVFVVPFPFFCFVQSQVFLGFSFSCDFHLLIFSTYHLRSFSVLLFSIFAVFLPFPINTHTHTHAFYLLFI